MGQLRSAFGITLIIGALVAAAAWYARLSDRGQSMELYFNAATPSETPSLPPVFGWLDWGADGETTLLTYAYNAEQGITLFNLPQKSSRKIKNVGLGAMSAARLSPDRRHVLAATQAGALWWIDVDAPDSPARLADLPSPQVFPSLAITGRGDWIAAGSTAGALLLWNPTNSGRVHIATASPVADVRFSGDGLRLVSAHADGAVRVWEVTTGAALAEFAHEGPALASAFLPDSERIISAGGDDTFRMWEIAGEQEYWRQETEPLGARSLAVSADGSLAACGGHSHCIIVWDLDRCESKFEIFTSASSVSHLSFSPDSSQLAALETDGERSFRLYDMQRGRLVRRISMEGEDIP